MMSLNILPNGLRKNNSYNMSLNSAINMAKFTTRYWIYDNFCTENLIIISLVENFC